MRAHFVTFYSPGTMVAEQTTKPIDSWDVKAAMALASGITERHNAKPYGFRFTTRERGPDDLDSHVAAQSNFYWIVGKVRTLAEVVADNDPGERILIRNMRCNGWDRIISTTEGWHWSQPFDKDDVLLSSPSQVNEKEKS